MAEERLPTLSVGYAAEGKCMSDGCSNLVSRLRNFAANAALYDDDAILAHEAADEIERLTQERDHFERSTIALALDVKVMQGMLAAKDSAPEAASDILEKARIVIASAYQAVGCLVHTEPDIVPSEADQTALLDMLSRWEGWSLKQVEEFLPWPRVWADQKAKEVNRAAEELLDTLDEWDEEAP